ncbi:uncharacterized protein LOC130800774 [Amaranthus tricolor]|uniref:uncharacterized protein LOC130800774 n=1 Tax=Amaranthus tricolor TaxID=29722 RepID=UPI00258788B2|nr:uncharacterized protein LOC130800774 [Amaranthus tricolor]XP_057520414.1 uncharacterized protein LOC130800774 [Amaranthus tricolor]XP_057520415.1 uncharacterized protein LOC130800774 [Amaranthus tricolor]
MANLGFRRLVFFLHQRCYIASSSSSNTLNYNYSTTSKRDNRFSTSTETCNSASNLSFCIDYLTNSCGLSLHSAISISKKVKLKHENKQRFDSIVSFFKSHKFSDSHIVQLIEKYPAVLNCKIVSNVEPKIHFLLENGFQGLLLQEFVVSVPEIFGRSLNDQLKPIMALLKKHINSQERIIMAIRRGKWLLGSDYERIQQNSDFLIEEGVPKERVENLYFWQPEYMSYDHSRVKYVVEKLKTMGIFPCNPMYVHSLRMMLSLSELSWKKKVKIFESLGWSYDDFISTFKRYPFCLCCSEEKLKKSMEYFVNTVKLDRRAIIACPKILNFSIEKRVFPRFTVWKVLEERNLNPPQFIWMLNRTEKVFIERHVTKYADTIPDLLRIYQTSKEMP